MVKEAVKKTPKKKEPPKSKGGKSVDGASSDEEDRQIVIKTAKLKKTVNGPKKKEVCPKKGHPPAKETTKKTDKDSAKAPVAKTPVSKKKPDTPPSSKNKNDKVCQTCLVHQDTYCRSIDHQHSSCNTYAFGGISVYPKFSTLGQTRLIV